MIILVSKKEDISNCQFLSNDEKAFVNKQIEDKEELIQLSTFNQVKIILAPKEKDLGYMTIESLRKLSSNATDCLNKKKQDTVEVISFFADSEYTKAALESILLSNYQFIKYFKDKDKKQNKLANIKVYGLTSEEIIEVENIAEATNIARTMVNEPVSALDAEDIAQQAKELGDKYGFKVDVFNKQKIESLKMGGLLAVNKGSFTPPTFTVMEYKSENSVNKKPIVFVGKGIVYDTGGLSLKPSTAMDTMKSDMGGAAAVIGAITAIAKNKLPVHVVALVPATDNRPGNEAYAPGDVVEMYDGTTVEVLNTDAEGRMVLADALSYAKKYDPEFVVDLATLTGAALVAVGPLAIASMGTAKEGVYNAMIEAGNDTYERLAALPFWEEYAELIKSDIADLKNIGGRDAGSITAGKFLEHFTDYPWLHLDIAGPAFLDAKSSYRPKGGTGVGVRLLYNFMKNLK
ncbi:MAG: leucyl aminopeptidase [Ichthyobacteriaceae bacterium]|nr:leucyl aminopeptidase [Ichthyobacteriaceae bacterium]